MCSQIYNKRRCSDVNTHKNLRYIRNSCAAKCKKRPKINIFNVNEMRKYLNHFISYKRAIFKSTCMESLLFFFFCWNALNQYWSVYFHVCDWMLLENFVGENIKECFRFCWYEILTKAFCIGYIHHMWSKLKIE